MSIRDPFEDHPDGTGDDDLFGHNQQDNVSAASATAPKSAPAPAMDTVNFLESAKARVTEIKENIVPDLTERVQSAVSKVGRIMEVTVSDPEKKGDGMSAFVTYKVNTKVETVPGKFKQSSVVRRYSDFSWMRAQLTARLEGWLVPPLPGKAIIGRFSPMFVDSRRRGLEVFLNRIAQHEHLSVHPEVKLFLHGGEEFDVMRAGKAAEPIVKKEPKGFFGYFNELSQTVSNTWGAGKEREKTPDDIICDNINEYSSALHTNVSAVHSKIEVLTSKTKDIGNAWFDFGFNCTLLGQFETEQDEAHLGSAFAKLGYCADRLNLHMQQLVDNQLIHFQEPFDDLLRQIEAVQEMLKARAAALLTYQTTLSQLESKQTSAQKYEGKPGREDKAEAMGQVVVEAQQKVDASLKNLQQVTARVVAEAQRFRKERRASFKNILGDYVRMQIETSKKLQQSWESILADIE